MPVPHSPDSTIPQGSLFSTKHFVETDNNLHHFLQSTNDSRLSFQTNMTTFLSPDEKHIVQHDEKLGDKDESPARRYSVVAEINHSEAPIWEQRQTYGKSGTLNPIGLVCFFLTLSQGFMGIFTSKYVFLCAAFATMGGLLFGYE